MQGTKGGDSASPGRESKDSTRSASPKPPAKATRRRFTIEYKVAILEEADRNSSPRDVNDLLRREELTRAHLSAWRKAARRALLARLEGPKPGSVEWKAGRIGQLEREVKELRQENRQLRFSLEAREMLAGFIQFAPEPEGPDD